MKLIQLIRDENKHTFLFLFILIFQGCTSEKHVLTEQVVSGVYRIAASRSNTYLLAGDTLALIDTGMPGDGEAILNFITSLGRRPEELKYIFITHAHLDHMGALHHIKNATNARIVASAQESDYIRGLKKTWTMGREGMGGTLFRAALFFMETFRLKYEPAAVDVACGGGETIDCLGGIRVIATPGHSPGSLSYYMPERGIVFTGDAVSGSPKPGLPQRFGCADYQQALASVKQIAECTFSVCCFGHGKPVKDDADAVIKELLREKQGSP